MNDMWFVYILRLSDDSLYTGITNDLEKRLEAHREGNGSKYVRSRLPLELVYCETVENRSEATKREMEIKDLSKEEKEELVDSMKV
ncbi:MAG: GIY-YIG nuclease family protein [Thermoplasmatota archaeon]